MVGLHVLHDKIIGRATVQSDRDVFKPLGAEGSIDGIHHRDFFVDNDVRVVCHAVFHDVLPLKQVKVSIVHTDVFYIV